MKIETTDKLIEAQGEYDKLCEILGLLDRSKSLSFDTYMPKKLRKSIAKVNKKMLNYTSGFFQEQQIK